MLFNRTKTNVDNRPLHHPPLLPKRTFFPSFLPTTPVNLHKEVYVQLEPTVTLPLQHIFAVFPNCTHHILLTFKSESCGGVAWAQVCEIAWMVTGAVQLHQLATDNVIGQAITFTHSVCDPKYILQLSNHLHVDRQHSYLEQSLVWIWNNIIRQCLPHKLIRFRTVWKPIRDMVRVSCLSSLVLDVVVIVESRVFFRELVPALQSRVPVYRLLEECTARCCAQATIQFTGGSVMIWDVLVVGKRRKYTTQRCIARWSIRLDLLATAEPTYLFSTLDHITDVYTSVTFGRWTVYLGHQALQTYR